MRGGGGGGSGGGGGGGSRRGGGRREGEGAPGISLLVRNIGPNITNHDLGVAFGRIGDVRDVYIPRDYHSQQAKGFAFIEYADPEQAREARDEMDRFRIKGCELEVVFAQERRKSPNEMRGRVVNQQNAGGRDGGGRDGSRDGGGRDAGGRDGGRDGGRERSSSFERHQKQRRRDEGRRFRDDKDDNDNSNGSNNRSSANSNSKGGGDEKAGQDKEKSNDQKGGEE